MTQQWYIGATPLPAKLCPGMRPTEAGCRHCDSGFWCPWHSHDGLIDDVSEYEENLFLKKRNELLEDLNETRLSILRDLQTAASFYFKIRDRIEVEGLTAYSDGYALHRLRQALKSSYQQVI